MFQGSMVAIVTPMHEDGSVDNKSLEALLEFHLDSGTDAIVIAGTTGESATLDETEHCKLIADTVAMVERKIPVIAGTGANSTREAIELTKCAKTGGADACLLVTPYYNKPTQEGLYQHYKMIAESVAIPQILYNVPGRTACDMSNETTERLADISNIVGIKDATGDLDRGEDLIKRLGDRMEVYSGDDGTTLELIRRGARGGISVTANVAPAKMHKMCTAALAGDFEAAAAINEFLLPLHSNLFLEANPIPVKWAVHEMGMITSGIRLPLTPLAEQYHQPLRDAMITAGAL
ncbi:MAG: 4-hydroxy-tetrahydrodipicolinate synthase [Gammaproteobacteria bacterium]|nr:4-hydroxy-tetrahydrodipicolinate synthase [Gammaproteobacteria bacterium]